MILESTCVQQSGGQIMVLHRTFLGFRDFLRNQSNWLWDKQNEAYCVGLTLNEETLTEMLLNRMATHLVRTVLSQNGIKFDLTIFNKHEEKIDWSGLGMGSPNKKSALLSAHARTS